jgi:hypothetical protein
MTGAAADKARCLLQTRLSSCMCEPRSCSSGARSSHLLVPTGLFVNAVCLQQVREHIIHPVSGVVIRQSDYPNTAR